MIDQDLPATEPPLPNIALPGALSVGSAATWTDGSAESIARAQAAFAEGHALMIPAGLDPPLLETVLSICRGASYVPEEVGHIGWRTIEEHDRAGLIMRFIFERPAFLRWVETVTRRETLQRVTGVVAEMAAGTGQGLDWHDDCNEPARRLAVTVQLSDAPMQGGVFEMCEAASGRLIVQQPPSTAGGILLFKVSKDLRHRVTPVTSGGPRRVFAGWITV